MNAHLSKSEVDKITAALTSVGTLSADAAVAAFPLPWTPELGTAMTKQVMDYIDEMIIEGGGTAPDPVFRELAAEAFAKRYAELYHAWAAAPLGGRQ